MRKSVAIFLILLAFVSGVLTHVRPVLKQESPSRIIHFIPLDKKAKSAYQHHSWGKWWI